MYKVTFVEGSDCMKFMFNDMTLASRFINTALNTHQPIPEIDGSTSELVVNVVLEHHQHGTSVNDDDF